MKNITVIIPVHKLTKELSDYLSVAINSIAVQEEKPEKILIVTKNTKTLLSDVEIVVQNFKEVDGLTIEIIPNKGNSDYASQVNLGVEKATTEWVSILNMDDKYTPKWFKQFYKYININQNVDMFLPIIQELSVDGKFLGFKNEAVWAQGFTSDMGLLNYDTLLDINLFSIDGAFIKKDTFVKIGGLKSNIVYSFEYEFLLRLSKNNTIIMTIPKTGYMRTNGRDGSLIDSYAKTLTQPELKFWLSTAKKECFFKEDRQIDTSFIEDAK